MSPTTAKKQSPRILAGSGVGSDPDWGTALSAALDAALKPLRGQTPHLLLLFASDAFADDFGRLLAEAAERSGAHEIAGCTGGGVIGSDHEIEGEPAVSALALRLPTGAFISVRAVTQEDVEELSASVLGLQRSACTGWVILADPFSLNVETLIESLAREYPDSPLVGGLASGTHGARRTYLFSGSRVLEEGAVLVGFSGSVRIQPVVSQGCQPIGEPWTVTDARGHVVHTIGNRKTLEVLLETLHSLSEPERRRVTRNLLVGLAMDEYRDSFGRGDFLIRNLVGVDQSSGAVAVSASPRVGQTLQFQVRDARAADEELRQLLSEQAGQPNGRPAAALLFACNGRGAGLFGEPDHDARVARELLGGPALAGFFCNGEIGPVGRQTYLHGFTASLGLVVPVTGERATRRGGERATERGG